MADHQNRHQMLLFLYLTMKQQEITRTPLMEMNLGTRGTLSQRMSLPNPQVSFGSCHSRRSGIGKSETTAFQQLDVHERKRLCRAQTLRKHQISTAASTLPKTWLSMTINVNFANGVTRYSWGDNVVWLKENWRSPSELNVHWDLLVYFYSTRKSDLWPNRSFSKRWRP